jgi:hypothetical protein
LTRPLRGKAEIGLAVGAVVAKHFELVITDHSFAFRMRHADVEREALVERAFRILKSIDLQIRPVHLWIEPQVRADAFLCTLAYYVECHLRETWAPILFHEHDRPAAEVERPSPVASAALSSKTNRSSTKAERQKVPRRRWFGHELRSRQPPRINRPQGLCWLSTAPFSCATPLLLRVGVMP